MKPERLPWFPCNPTKLLGALAQMTAPEQLTYVVVLLRIYECGGACPDSLDAISRRVRYNKRVVSDVLNNLFETGRLRREADGIHNPIADGVLEDQRALRERRADAGRKGAEAKAEKPKRNQKPDDSKASDLLKHGRVEKEEDSLFPDGKRVSARSQKRTTLAPDWQPTVADLDYAKEHGFDRARAGRMAAAFADHHRGKGNRMADWDAAWRTWVRNEIKFSSREPPNGKPPNAGSASAAAGNFAEQARSGDLRIAPRPTLLPRPGEADVRLLPAGRRE